jgi:hypothetical protein
MPDAIQTLIAQLEQNTYSLNVQNVICQISELIAALNEIESSIGPTPGPYLPLAGGTMTGTETFSDGGTWGSTGPSTTSDASFGNVNVSGTTVPTVGIYQPGANQLGFSAGGNQFTLNGTALNAANTAGPRIVNTAPSSTAPDIIPNRGSTNTGLGAQAAGNMSLIGSGVEIERITATARIVEKTYTFATLPTGAAGMETYITDGAALPVFSAAAAGSGTLFTPVYYDGSIWRNG